MSSTATPPPQLTAAIAALRRRPQGSALLFDVDGTLAPITTDPAAASVPPETRELLAVLAERYGLVACVSGRTALRARAIVGLGQLAYIGNHGLERLEPGASEPALDPALGGAGAAAREFVAGLSPGRLEEAGLRLEDKGPIQSLHWRGAPDETAAEAAAWALADELPDTLRPHWGRKVLELRPAVPVDKGTAVRALLAGAGLQAALYAGDDRTDLDVFRALRELAAAGELEPAVCVAVDSPEGPPELAAEADAVVDGTAGVTQLLRALAD